MHGVTTRLLLAVAVLLVVIGAAVLMLQPRFLRPEHECAGATIPRFAQPRPTPSALRGLRVVLNPGHGLTQGDNGAWEYQRPAPNGQNVFVQEDDSNVRLARTLRDALVAAGATVQAVRELDDTRPGQSGTARTLEAARHHAARLGLPRFVFASQGDSLRGDCAAGQDLRARGLMANHWQADVMLSLHSNAGRPEARGTWVIYGEQPYLLGAAQDWSQKNACLARRMASRLPERIRKARPDLAWPNANLVASDNYGENGYALMPSVLLEVAFHTNRSDGRALGEDSFRAAVAAGVLQGLQDFVANPSCLQR